MSGSLRRIAVAIVVWDDQVLIGRRAETGELDGYWEFPGGKIEPGESAVQAAERECLEETGIPVRAVESIATVRYEYDFGARELSFVRCALVEFDRPPRTPYRWVPIDSLHKYAFPPANRPILDILH